MENQLYPGGPGSAPESSEEHSLEEASRFAREAAIPELLEPVVREAGTRLSEIAAHRAWDFAPSGFDDLLQGLRQGLARLTNSLILQRFSAFNLIGNPLWRPREAAPGNAPAGSPIALLQSYISWEQSQRLWGEDGPYPELGRLLKLSCGNWLSAAVELLDRVLANGVALSAMVGCSPRSLGPLTGATWGESDPHCGGRTVVLLDFGGRKAVYKPRSLGAENAWQAIFRRVLSGSLALDNRAIRIQEAEGYGFSEFVAPHSCVTTDAVRRCYLRYGALLATAHALGTCDLHHENVIVAGEYPIVVDAEPLFRARLGVSADGESRLAFERNLSLEGLEYRESILELGVLPMTMAAPIPPKSGQTPDEYEIGALSAYGRKAIQTLVLCGRNSDDLQMRTVSLRASSYPNLPTLEGSPQFPEDYVDEIVAGFRATHRFLRETCQRYVGPGGLLEALASTPIRLLARPTMEYSAVLVRSLSPEALRSTEARADKIGGDLRYLAATRFDVIQQLEHQEVASLLAGDIPRFDLRAGDAAAGASLIHSPIEAARRRWEALDEMDIELQVVAIRERLRRSEPPSPLAIEQVPAAASARSTDRLIKLAMATTASLVDAVIYKGHRPSWVYATYAPGLAATTVHADRQSLYDGAVGTAVAVAEAGRIAGKRSWMDLARRIFESIEDDVPTECLRRGGGLARGLGGLAYGMARVADATGDESLTDRAERLLVEYGASLAVSDELDEVLYGRSGLLLAVLALLERRPSEELRTIADTAAKELLRRAVSAGIGIGWPVSGGRPMPNVSHGAAGIAMALARWAQVRGDDRAATAAVQALLFDDTFWVAEERGWKDARLERPAGEPLSNWGWCNGRSGALVARLAVAEALDLPFNLGTIADALSSEPADVLTKATPGLCCGTAGALDALLCVDEKLGTRESGLRVAEALATVSERTPMGHLSTLNPSLFAGSAGHVFSLLRAARPTEVKPIIWFG